MSKTKKQLEEALLREYIRNSLVVESSEGVTGSGLYKAFIQPFTDVLKTAVGKTKEITRSAATLLNVSFRTIATTLIPGLRSRYSKIFEKEKQDIEAIRSKYKDVYDRTDNAFGSDTKLLAFMASPAVTMGVFAAKAAPGATKELLSAITGGYSDKLLGSAGKAVSKAAKKTLDPEKETKGGRQENRHRRLPALHEDKQSDLESRLKDPDFLAKALSSPAAQEMQRDATEVYRNTLKSVYAQVDAALKKADSLDGLEKMLGESSPELKGKFAELKRLPAEEKKKSADVLLKETRDSIKKLYVEQLKKKIEEVKAAGIPEEAQFVKDYARTIQKIEEL